ncbi:MAG: tandem-95 repeat protein, partial [Acinetobacter sp.]
DGSQTFFIDLDQALIGREVLLSFDLLGFAAADSSVTLSNIRLIAEPLAMNDHYQLDEDTTVTGNVINNDLLVGKTIENVVLVTTPQHGELMLKANGEFSYTPHANYFGTDQFSYYFITEGTESKVATVILDIQSINDVPTFVQQPNWEIIAGQPLILDFDQYVLDADQDQIQINITEQPTSGSITYDAQTGLYTYIVDKDFEGADSFSLVLTDGTATSTTYTFSINVLASNTAPELTAQNVVTNEDQNLVIDLLATASDQDGDLLETILITQPEHGRLEKRADGRYEYMPTQDYSGTDHFSYRVTDGELSSHVVSVSIIIHAVNDAPELATQQLITDEDTPVIFNPLLTATDIDSAHLIAVIVTQPQYGQLTLLESGAYLYVPFENYNGTDSFTYLVNDGELNSHIATVSIEVRAVNDAPVLKPRTISMVEDGQLILNLLENATDVEQTPLSIVIVTPPEHGQFIDLGEGNYHYIPELDYHGEVTLSYYVTDGELNSEIVDINITITPVNDAPVASPMIKTMEEDTEIVFSLLTNAQDVDGDTLKAVVVTSPSSGKLTETLPGIYHYVPEANFNGEVTFSYYVTDGQLQSEIVNVLLIVTPVNDKPTVSPRIISMVEDGQLMVNLLENAIDVDGDELSIVITAAPLHGQFIEVGAGYYHYIPEPNFNGEVKLSYYVTDGKLNSDIVNILIIVNPVNDAPILLPQNIQTMEDTPVFINPLATASDIDGDQLVAVIATEPKHGQVIKLSNGQYQYVPSKDFNGIDDFSYFVTDSSLNSQIVTVTITVSAVNDAPITSNGWVKGFEDQVLILKWQDFAAQDTDSDDLWIEFIALPQAGLVQLFKDNQWIAISNGVRVSKTEIDAGKVRFVPTNNEASDVAIAGIGNNKQVYAQIAYKAFDGNLYSTISAMNIEIEAIADQPVISVGAATIQEVLFQTGWESASNKDTTSALLEQNVFEGWTLLKESDCYSSGKDGFEIWSNNDRMENAYGQLKTVYAKAAHGQNWLELNDAGLLQAQTLGISRNVQTEAGRSYNLSFDYAGRLGFNECYTQIGIYIDGKRIATYANTSSNEQLNWKNLQFSFIGNGKSQNIQIRIDAPMTHINGRGAMIDNIELSTTKTFNSGLEDQPLQISALKAVLQDMDGSEQLKLAITGMPVGSSLTDGINTLEVTQKNTVADISSWNLNTLSFTPPKDLSGEVKVQFVASSVERSSASVATAIHELTLQVQAVADMPVLETQQSQQAMTSRQLFETEWEGIYNAVFNKNATVIYGSYLDGWTGRSDQMLKLDAFEVWHSGDQIRNTVGQMMSLQSSQGNAWIRLNDGKDTLYQQNAIERKVLTSNGTIYNLSLDLAGLLGRNADAGRIGIYVDGQRIATYDAVSGQTALNWQQYNIEFAGNGKERILRIQLEGNIIGRSAFISNIRLVETYISTANTVYAAIGQTTYLPVIAARTADEDGSEMLKLEISGFSQGTVLTDGTNYITIQSAQQWIDISQWDTTQLRFASNSRQNMSVQLRATAIEQSNQHSMSTLTTIQINMLGGSVCTTPWQLLNGFVSAWTNQISPVALTVKAQWACPIQFNTQVDFTMMKSAQDEDDEWLILREQKQSDAWLKALELQAQQNWKKLL